MRFSCKIKSWRFWSFVLVSTRRLSWCSARASSSSRVELSLDFSFSWDFSLRSLASWSSFWEFWNSCLRRFESFSTLRFCLISVLSFSLMLWNSSLKSYTFCFCLSSLFLSLNIFSWCSWTQLYLKVTCSFWVFKLSWSFNSETCLFKVWFWVSKVWILRVWLELVSWS